MRRTVFVNPILIVIAWLALLSGCARLPDTGKTLLKPKTFSELQGYLQNHKPDLDQFRASGPFDVSERDNFEIRLSATEVINSDLFLSAHAEKAPLVIILHGYDTLKDAHRYQAMHLASWGMHCLTVQLPNKGPWVANGKTLAKIVKFIYRSPEIIDKRVDVNKIIVIGHSFGGASVAIALSEGAPAAGGILLDPAFLGNNVPKAFRQINLPVLVLGADEHFTQTRNRNFFYNAIPRGVAEVSIRDAVHEDGQYPSPVGLATEPMQITFVSAMTAGAFSLSFGGNFNYAWSSFDAAVANGKFFNARRK